LGIASSISCCGADFVASCLCPAVFTRLFWSGFQVKVRLGISAVGSHQPLTLLTNKRTSKPISVSEDVRRLWKFEALMLWLMAPTPKP
jgi:hypothetical protein